MTSNAYHIVSETTEDRFDETDGLDEAVRIAREVVRDGRTDDPVSIEHNGRVIRQFVLTVRGIVVEIPVHCQETLLEGAQTRN